MKIAKKENIITHRAVSVTIGTAVLISCIAGMTAGCSSAVKETGNTETEITVETSAESSEESTLDQICPSDETIATTTKPLTAKESAVNPLIAELQDEFEAELALVPELHMKFLKERGWKIQLTTKNLAEEYDYPSYICGITLYEEKIIYIDADEWAIRRSTIHEIGHAI